MLGPRDAAARHPDSWRGAVTTAASWTTAAAVVDAGHKTRGTDGPHYHAATTTAAADAAAAAASTVASIADDVAVSVIATDSGHFIDLS